MYRYYSTEYPIRPDTFPLFANTVVSFKEKTDIPGVGFIILPNFFYVYIRILFPRAMSQYNL